MNWVYYILMFIVMLIGLFVTIVGMPGLWLLVAGYGAFGWATGWGQFVGWPSMITLIVLAMCAEVVEFFAGAAGSKAAGGRLRGMIGAIFGAFIGAIVGSFFLPVVGTVVGAVGGAFVGAAVLEFFDKDLEHSVRVGWGAAKGRFWGIVSKLAFGIVMLMAGMIVAFPVGGGTKSTAPLVGFPAPSTLPATTQSFR